MRLQTLIELWAEEDNYERAGCWGRFTFSVEMQRYKHACLSVVHIFSSKLTETPSFFTGMGEE
jgi:hypothetical protein